MHIGTCLDKTTERALYRRNIEFDTIDEYKDKNIFNRNFKPSKNVWKPTNSMKKGNYQTLGPIPEHMSPEVDHKPKQHSKPTQK